MLFLNPSEFVGMLAKFLNYEALMAPLGPSSLEFLAIKYVGGKKRLHTENAASLVQNKNKIRNPILRADPNGFLDKNALQVRGDSMYLPDLGLKVLG